MVQLDLDNVYLKITGLEKDEEMKLWNLLSFPVQVFGMQEVRYRHLYNRKTKKTYAGLLEYVEGHLKDRNIKYILKDNRIKPQQNANFKLVDYIDNEKKIPLKLRPYQQDIVDKCREREVIQAATGAGKALPLDTDILTPNGFVKMRDIHVGSVVYDENGEETSVIAEFPQNELKQEYKITFNDGSYVICCKEHLWKYDVKTNLKHHRWKVNNIVDIINKYGLKKSGSLNIYIPVCKPIKFDKKELFIPPYLMGALLGDGGFTQNTISFTNVEKDIIDKVNLLVSTWGVFKHKKNKSHPQLHFVGGENNLFKKYIENTFHHANSKTKFIPNEYKMSSIEDRLELIRGLIDTDGSINEKGHIKISFVGEQLAKDLQFVLQSLGYRSKMTIGKRKGRNDTYNLYIRGCDDKLFSSIKHKERFKHHTVAKNHYYDILKIVSVEPLDKKSEMKCITVDSPLHTYICKDFIVTHNTLMMAGCIAKFNVKPVCIFADKIGLCQQLKQEMEKFLGVEVGLVGDGHEDYKDITVISVQSADEKYIQKAQMCLWDECHHVPSHTIVSIANKCTQAYYRVGVSATPWRDAGDDLLIEAVLNKKKDAIISASKLIELGYLIKPDIYFVPIKQVFKGKNYQDIYKKAIVENIDRNKIVCKIAYNMFIRNKHVLILYKNIAHGETLRDMMEKRLNAKATPITVNHPVTGKEQTIRVKPVELLSGNDDTLKRVAVFEAVKRGICRCLIASTIADEGLDLPILDTLILAGGGKSSTRAFQRVGRVLRLHEGKTKAIVFDFTDYTPMLRRHSRNRQKYYEQEPMWDIHKFNVNPD